MAAAVGGLWGGSGDCVTAVQLRGWCSREKRGRRKDKNRHRKVNSGRGKKREGEEKGGRGR